MHIRWKNHLPRLVLLEKYENPVKWTLRILTVIGIASSVIAIPTWYSSMIISLSLFIIEQFFEKTIFQYTTIYVQPMPDFTYEPSEWKAMAFMAIEDIDPRIISSVGLVFNTKEYAKKVFTLFKSWNYNNNYDEKNNICLSFIIEKNNEYSTYLYPNPDRESILKFWKESEEELKFEKYGKEHFRIIMQMIFCKHFTYNKDSLLNKFIEMQKEGRPFWLQAFLVDQNNNPVAIKEIEPILKHNYRFLKREELTKNSNEYLHGKYVMNL
jgi:hypothetical protein